MTKLFMAIFGAMTLGASYMTVNDVGVMEPSIEKHSVRTGSTHRGVGGVLIGGYRGGK
ncbi:MAG: hypothetical protein ACI8PT_002392 [Gammaproteobacteria bacterium]|jgi:hypothetical protein